MSAETADRKTTDAPLARRPPNRQTRRSVLIIDKAANWTITVGGLFVIVAVFGIMAFLAEVVVPLFTGGAVGEARVFSKAAPEGRVLLETLDEYKTLSVSVSETGKVTVFHLGAGAALQAPQFDFGGRTATAFARPLGRPDVAFGFDDGSVRIGKVAMEVRILTPESLPAGLRELDERDRTDGTAVFSRIPGNQYRKLTVSLELGEPRKISDVAIYALDYRIGGTVERPAKAFVTVDTRGFAKLSRTETRVNLLTGQAAKSVASATLPELPKGLHVSDLLITEKADQVYIAERSGHLYRYDARNFDAPVLAETVDLLPGEAEITVLGFMIGEQSIVVGGSDGSFANWSRLQAAGVATKDGYHMVKTHDLERHSSGVVAMDQSQRGRTVVTADADGNVWLRHTTSEQTLKKLADAAGKTRIGTVALSPREDGVIALGNDRSVYAWDVSIPHPETTFSSIFGKVWYEGYPGPEYTWQSSSGTDSFEPKFSLIPLIFGTVKATLYSLLFAIPIALLGAIYTSEFVHHGVRMVVKPAMEMMASLPSVVLGFIAALILAPIVETWIAAVILAFVVLPLSLFACSYLWQLLPTQTALRWGGLPKFALMFMALGVGVWIALQVGPLFERLFFAGDLKAWANGDTGSGVPFTALLLLPAMFVCAMMSFNRFMESGFAARIEGSSRRAVALADGVRWSGMLAVAGFASYILAAIVGMAGYDPRGGFVDTYAQRNTLVVGFAMGFAVIPIIYTIAEDALNAVPEHLRAASLACGATPWQMATSVILPTAMSGVFSAVMIGMGRAVGETMIVVMAAGNTPIMEWNIFSGLRALSANIAVELPEAVKDGTLYRMLFLAALTLFVMTFIINTVAEVVRQRFRKRAAQL